MQLIENALKFRYATKKFSKTARIDTEQLEQLLETARLMPSSYGLQPYRFIAVTDQRVKEQLSPVCYNQPQIKDCSVLLIGQSLINIEDTDIEQYISQIARDREEPRDHFIEFEKMIKGALSMMDDHLSWAQKQLYLASGAMLLHAAIDHIDTCPMEGFQPDGIDALLTVPEQKKYRTSLLIALGQRDQNDLMQKKSKSRKKLKDFVIYI